LPYIALFCVDDRRYYKKQDELISAYEGIHLDNSKLNSDTTRIQLRKQATRLAKLSFFMNFVSPRFFSTLLYVYFFLCTSLISCFLYMFSQYIFILVMSQIYYQLVIFATTRNIAVSSRLQGRRKMEEQLQ